MRVLENLAQRPGVTDDGAAETLIPMVDRQHLTRRDACHGLGEAHSYPGGVSADVGGDRTGD